jgi:hypothetical protein
VWYQPLVASVMNACLLCNRPDEALRVFDECIGAQPGISGEWQWGGGRDRIDPLCRDLAMRAMAAKDGMSEQAMEFFHQTEEEGVTISFDALRGVILACEQDGNWEAASSVIMTILDRSNNSNWIVRGSNMSISDIASEVVSSNELSVAVRWLPEMGDILASVIRTCNSTSNFGIAMLCLRLVELHLPSTVENLEQVLGTTSRDNSSDMLLEQSLVSLLLKMRHTEEVLTATMVSLCGLRCYSHAVNLYDILLNAQHPTDTRLETDDRSSYSLASLNSQLCYEYAMSEVVKREPTLLGDSWTSANRHLHKITAAVLSIRGEEEISPKDREVIDMILATAMHACTESHQPETSLFLALWAEKSLQGRSSKTSANGSVRSFFGLGKTETGNVQHYGFRMDVLLAEAISANRWSQKTNEAMDLFESLKDSHSTELSRWKLSCNAGMSLLFSVGRFDDALDFFNGLDDSARTVDTFSIAAKCLTKEKRWKEIGAIYRGALATGRLSEELGLLTMNSVRISKVDNQMRVLRAIVEDTAKCSGSDPINWMEAKYFQLKRTLGFRYARLLLWWDDPATCHLDELQLALEDFDKRMASGLKAKHDVIRLIVFNAKSFQEGAIPEGTGEVARVPRTESAWLALLGRVLEETRDSSLQYDAHFVSDVIKALRRLRNNRECVSYVNEALLRGVLLHKTAMVEALAAAEVVNSRKLKEDIQMLLHDNNSG